MAFLVKTLAPTTRGRDYSGGSVPDFPADAGSRGSLHLDIADQDNSLLTDSKKSVKFSAALFPYLVTGFVPSFWSDV